MTSLSQNRTRAERPTRALPTGPAIEPRQTPSHPSVSSSPIPISALFRPAARQNKNFSPQPSLRFLYIMINCLIINLLQPIRHRSPQLYSPLIRPKNVSKTIKIGPKVRFSRSIPTKNLPHKSLDQPTPLDCLTPTKNRKMKHSGAVTPPRFSFREPGCHASFHVRSSTVPRKDAALVTASERFHRE